MAAKKTSPKREKTSPRRARQTQEDMMRYGGYVAMAFYVLLILSAIAATVCYLYYGIRERSDNGSTDNYEAHETAAYGAIISLLGAILILLMWVAYNVQRHM